MAKISIFGSGGWGTAAAVMLAHNGHKVTLCSHFEEESRRLSQARENAALLPGIEIPQSVRLTHIAADCFPADLAVVASPSFAVRGVGRQIKPYIAENQVIVNLSKGLETGTLLTLSRVLAEEVGESASIAVLSGPSHAEEVARNIPTTNVAAAQNPDVSEFVQNIFMNPRFRVYAGSDVLGVELGGALKNVIALCAGISDGLGFGDNTKAALMTRGIVEMTRLGVAMGAKAETFNGLAGIGDLIVTCTSMHSRNRRAGILIGQGLSASEAETSVKMTVEGINACRAAYALANKHAVEMPIVTEAYRILFERKPALDATLSLMERDKKEENICSTQAG